MRSFAAILPLAAACFVAAAAQQQNPPAPQSPAGQSQPASPPPGAPQSNTAPNPSSGTDQSQNPSAAPQATPVSAPNPQPGTTIATVALEGVSLSGSMSVEDGRAMIGNNGAITAGDRTARLSLTRGGNLNVCASTKIHLSTDNTVSGGGLMIALDRGALEAHYLTGQYSDVLLTPDLRILISGPGAADLSLRVSSQGDTCIDNHGDQAPYVLASSLFEGGAYRVQPNQRVLFEHGSLQQVVDNEKESCGCPPPAPIPTPTTIVGVGALGGTLRSSSQPTPAPPTNTTAAQNPFPLAQSEGLQSPPPPPSTAVVPPGEARAQVTAPLVYNGETSESVGIPASSLSASASTPASSAPPMPAPNTACSDPLFPGVVCDQNSSLSSSAPQKQNPPAVPAANTTKPKKKSAFARFLHKVFGGD
ncbi:MAG: hypothetical protein WA476_02365 [Acidobacteriaceae bacterium]